MPLFAPQPWRHTAYARRPRILTRAGVVTITGFRLIGRYGAPVTSASITAVIRKTAPASETAPDKVVTGLSPDGSGILPDISLAGVQANANPVWLTLMDEATGKGTTVRVTPIVT